MSRKIPFSRPAIIINASAGSTTDITPELAARLKAVGAPPVFQRFVDAQDIGAVLKGAIAVKPDLLIIYGGDGTALSGAKLANAEGIPILPLPGGTMNMLHKSFYGTTGWLDVVDVALARSEPHWRPAGFVGEHMFLVAAIIGTASRFALSREAIREGEIIEAVKEAVTTLSDVEPADTFSYAVGSNGAVTSETNLLQVTCPKMNDFAKRCDAFEVASIDASGYADILSLGLNAIRSNWRDDNVVQTDISDHVILSGAGRVDVLTDGDHLRLPLPINITIKTKGIMVLAPKPQ